MSNTMNKKPPMTRSRAIMEHTPAGYEQAAPERDSGAVRVPRTIEEEPLQDLSPAAAQVVTVDGNVTVGTDGSGNDGVDEPGDAGRGTVPPATPSGGAGVVEPVSPLVDSLYRSMGYVPVGDIYVPVTNEELQAMAAARDDPYATDEEAGDPIIEEEPDTLEPDQVLQAQVQNIARAVAPFLDEMRSEVQSDRVKAMRDLESIASALAQEQRMLREQAREDREALRRFLAKEERPPPAAGGGRVGGAANPGSQALGRSPDTLTWPVPTPGRAASNPFTAGSGNSGQKGPDGPAGPFNSNGAAVPPSGEFWPAASALGRAFIESQAASAGPRRLSLDSDVEVFAFMMDSSAVELADTKTAVTAAEGLREKPAKDAKAEIKQFYVSCAEDKLLVDFVDGVAHADYVHLRKRLVKKLAGLSYIQLEIAGDKDVAEASVCRHLTASIRHLAPKREYTKMATIEAYISVTEIQSGAMTPRDVLHAMDRNFASPSQVERDRELEMELSQISVSKGMLPSKAITQARLTFTRKFGPEQAVIIDRSVRSHITSMLTQDAKEYPSLQPFVNKLLETSFSAQPLEEWQSQFRIYEKQPGFADTLRAGAPAAKKVQLPPRTPRQDINLLGEDGSGTMEALVAALAAALTRSGALGAGGINALNNPPPAGGYRFSRGLEWVKDNGVEGFAAPGDDRREPLPIGQICKALDI